MIIDTLANTATNDVDLDLIQKHRVAILGYSELSLVQALNLRDSGVEVKFISEPSINEEQLASIQEQGFGIEPLEETLKWADIILVAGYAKSSANFFEGQVLSSLQKIATKKILVFSRIDDLQLLVDILPTNLVPAVLIPLASSVAIRQQFQIGKGVGVVLAIDASSETSLVESLVKAVGGSETETLITNIATLSRLELFIEKFITVDIMLAPLSKVFSFLVEEENYPPQLVHRLLFAQVLTVLENIKEQGIAGSIDLVSPLINYLTQLTNTEEYLDTLSGHMVENYRLLTQPALRKQINEELPKFVFQDSLYPKDTLQNIEKKIFNEATWIQKYS